MAELNKEAGDPGVFVTLGPDEVAKALAMYACQQFPGEPSLIGKLSVTCFRTTDDRTILHISLLSEFPGKEAIEAKLEARLSVKTR